MMKVVCKKWQKCVLKLLDLKKTLKRLDYSMKFVNPKFDKHGFIIDEGFILLMTITLTEDINKMFKY